MSRRSKRTPTRSKSRSPKRQKKNKDESSEESLEIRKSRPKNQLIDTKNLLLEGKRSRIVTIFGMGNNDYGQLGSHDKGKKGHVGVVGHMNGVNVMDFACGTFFNVVVEANQVSKSRRVWIWGTMNYKKDKNNKTFEKDDRVGDVPELVENLSKKSIIQCSAGDSHASVLTLEGEVYTWGIYKQKNGVNIGLNPSRPKDEFQDEAELVDVGEPVVQIGSTSNKTIALTEGGDVYEWGDCFENKRVTSRHTKDCLLPQYVNITKKVCKVFCSAGGESIFAVDPKGKVFCWGNDKYFQLGIFSQAYEDEKEKLRKKREEERRIKKEEEEKKLREEGKEVPESKKKKPKKPEENKPKKGGQETKDKEPKKEERKYKYSRPTDSHAINQLKKDDEKFTIKKIACGVHHTVLLDENGNVYTWGRNNYGQLGLGIKDEVVKEPTKVDLEDVEDIACGANHTMFLLRDGTVYACGLSKDERFNSKNDHEFKPIKIEGLDKSKIVGISCGKRHNLFIGKD